MIIHNFSGNRKLTEHQLTEFKDAKYKKIISENTDGRATDIKEAAEIFSEFSLDKKRVERTLYIIQ